MKKVPAKTLKTVISAFLLSSLLLGCTACAGFGAETPESHDYAQLDGSKMQYLTAREFSSTRSDGEVSTKFRKAAADFALRLLRACDESLPGDGGSTLVSPMSVMTALAMTANGARGETLKEMEKLLGGKLDIEQINEGLYNFFRLLDSGDDAKIESANSVWVTTNPIFSIDRTFISKIENTYNADVIGMDFTSPDAPGLINSWVNDKTDGMIKEIVSPDDLTEDTMMALINAIMFDALWADPIGDEVRKPGSFNGTAGKTDVTYLPTEVSDYIDGDNETGFIKYYAGNRYAFVALLPDNSADFDKYLSGLDGNEFLSLVGGAKNAVVYAQIPEFSTDYSAELNDVLAALGMPSAFDENLSDLSGLGTTADNTALYIDKVIHKTHLDLDGSGTRAAAVTAVLIAKATSASPMQQKTYYVNLDRPFVYAVIDTATGLPVFLGTCENVAATK